MAIASEGEFALSDTLNPEEVDAARTGHAFSRQSVAGDTPWTGEQYAVLVGLIKHCDDQIGSTNNIHMIAFGAMIPTLAILIKVQVPLVTHLGLMLLGVALAIRWLTMTSKLNTEKLCWVSLARQVEKGSFMQPPGAFTSQQTFFTNLPQHMGASDKLILRKIGTRRLYFISVILLVAAVVLAGLATLLGAAEVPF